MISKSRLLQVMTVSVPVILVAAPLLMPIELWVARARAAIKHTLVAYPRSSIALTPPTDASLPSETQPWSEAGKGNPCVDLPWHHVEPSRAAKPLDPKKAVVFRGRSAMSLLQQSARPFPCSVRGTWTPTDSQITQLEFDLARLLAHNERRTRAVPVSMPPFERFYRRYGGLSLEGGERIILVNAIFPPTFIPGPVQQWALEAESECGVKMSHYVVEYDPERRRFRGFAYKEAVQSNRAVKPPCAGPSVHLRASRDR